MLWRCYPFAQITLQGEFCMINIIAVFLGGGTGALLRWLACSKIPAHWGTLTVNIAGAFLIGILYQYIYLHAGFKQIGRAHV